MQKTLRLLALGPLVAAACGAPPPASTASPEVERTNAQAAPDAGASAEAGAKSAYGGHGAESVAPEVLARFAPTPLPPATSRRIQSMLDLRAPVASRISPDGRALYFAWNVTGTFQVWKADGPRAFPTQLTGGEDVTRVVDITPDGKRLLVLRDRKGEENPGLYLLSVDGGALTPIQHLPKVQTELQVLGKSGKRLYYRANDVKPDAYAIYAFDLGSATAKPERIFGEDGLWTAEDLRELPAGDKLLLGRATGALTKEYFELDVATKKLTPLFGQGEKEEYVALYGAADDEILVQTAKFGNFRRLYRVRAAGLAGKPLEAAQATAVTPSIDHDVAAFSIDAARKRVYYTLNERGYTRARAMDARTWKEERLPAFQGEDHVTFGAPTPDGRFVPINAASATHATTSSVWDWNQRKLVQWVVPSAPELDPSKFAVPSLESYTARDGTRIPIFVRRPKACASAPCPVIVHFHGGPESQARAGMNTYGQVFVDAGFVWVEPNVRGSDGYGKAWLHADDGPRRLDVITDIEDAAKHVRAAFAHEGTAPRVGVFGGSYGGYSTLMAMTKFAGAFDAGVAVVGMSNLHTFLMNTAPYRRALRISEYGDPEKDREALRELSPITHIAKVEAPLLLIQGASDPRVPIGEAVQMHAALEERGQRTKMIIFPDEGHGTQKRENKVLEIGHTLDFFVANLQAKGTPR